MFVLTHQQLLRQGSSTSISRGSCEDSWLLPVCRLCIFSSRVLQSECVRFSPLSVDSSDDTYYSVWVWNLVLKAQQLKMFRKHSSSVILQLALTDLIKPNIRNRPCSVPSRTISNRSCCLSCFICVLHKDTHLIRQTNTFLRSEILTVVILNFVVFLEMELCSSIVVLVVVVVV